MVRRFLLRSLFCSVFIPLGLVGGQTGPKTISKMSLGVIAERRAGMRDTLGGDGLFVPVVAVSQSRDAESRDAKERRATGHPANDSTNSEGEESRMLALEEARPLTYWLKEPGYVSVFLVQQVPNRVLGEEWNIAILAVGDTLLGSGMHSQTGALLMDPEHAWRHTRHFVQGGAMLALIVSDRPMVAQNVRRVLGAGRHQEGGKDAFWGVDSLLRAQGHSIEHLWLPVWLESPDELGIVARRCSVGVVLVGARDQACSE